MMKARLRLFWVAAAAAVLAFGTLGARAADDFPPAGTYKWKFFMPWGPGPWNAEPTRKFITQEIPKRTNGALQIGWFYPGEHPYAYTDILLALQEGAAQMGVTLGSYSGGLDARLEAHELPFLFPPASGQKYLDFMDVVHENIWNPMLAKSWGVKIAAFQLHPPNQIITDVAVDKPRALAGKKIRSFGLTGNLWIESLGGTGVSIAYPEVATALATGTVDGAISSIQAMHGAGWMDQTKVMTLVDVFVNPQWNLVSLDAYNKLDPVTRKAFDEAMVDMEQMLRRGYFLADYEAWRDAAVRLEVMTATPTRELRQQMAEHAEKVIWPAWVEKSGPEAGAVLNQIIGLRDQFDWKKK